MTRRNKIILLLILLALECVLPVSYTHLLLSLGSSFWNGLTQGQRFVTAMIPLLLSALLMLALVALDRKVPVTGHWKNVVRRRMRCV